MATDHYGSNIKVGDTVTRIGSSDCYIVASVNYGGDMVDLEGDNFSVQNVNSNDIIKAS